jgi:hypothetical protein
MFKVFRMGHRYPNKGVVTIASHIQDNKIFYGASYYSPNELTVPTFDENGEQNPFVQYNKQYGIDLASERLQDNIINDIFIPVSILKHGVVLLDIIDDIIDQGKYPKWAEQLIFENALYPVGLKRFNKKNENVFYGMKITVDSEEAKEQLLIASSYLHNLLEVDKSFIAVNLLSQLYNSPDIIEVK